MRLALRAASCSDATDERPRRPGRPHPAVAAAPYLYRGPGRPGRRPLARIKAIPPAWRFPGMPSLSPLPSSRPWRSILAVVALAAAAAAQPPADQAANLLLNGARRAYNEKNYPFAAARFREFLAKYAGHKEAASARYG